ncbi:MAG TPA: HD domain-containing phosphohydrolase [bacterium]|nr:HD domain-containing phosphohydrolase [bacterium]HPP07818.1 HD domain-containing phosphohydrolase [bacterium]
MSQGKNGKNNLEKRIEFLQNQLEQAHRDIEVLKTFPHSAFFEVAREWRSIFDSIAEIIFLINSQMSVIRCNNALTQFLKKPFDQIIGKKIDDIFHDENLVSLLKTLFLNMKQKLSRQKEIIKTSGKWYEITVDPIILAQRNDAAAIFVFNDITYLKEVEEYLKESHERLKKTLVGTVGALSTTVEKRDPLTAGHERRVATLAHAIALNLGMKQEDAEGILLTGLLHDVGKIVVPAEILSRPGKLNSYEYNIVKMHPLSGHEILRKIEFPWPVAETVLQHHERLDGSGYPQGIKKDQIIFEAKILAVADSVEAMLSHRPYRKQKSLAEAIDELKQLKGKHFDEQVVDACIDLFLNKQFVLK